jgi:hypothetical protein
MTSIYLSSTFEDLREYRTVVTDFLRRCGYDVAAMEKYGARDDRPKSACEADVANCDIYIGIFAWRYGHIPKDDNPEGYSITELEYLAAKDAKKPRLIFLLADDFPWKSSLRDAETSADAGARIRDLRNRLRAERWIAQFGSPDDLAKQVLASIIQSESTKRVNGIDILQDLQTAAEMGPSMFANIKDRFAQLGDAEFLAIRIEPTVWWNSRLHLAAALASDYTEIKEFLILDASGRVPVVASPVEIRRALTKNEPRFEAAYLASRQYASDNGKEDDINAIIEFYPSAIYTHFDKADERSIKRDLNIRSVRELGIRNEGSVLERSPGDAGLFPYADLMRGGERYVVLIRNGQLDGVIDRVDLASRMAEGGI